MTIKQALRLADSRETVLKTTLTSVNNDLAWAVRVLSGAYRREKLISKKYKELYDYESRERFKMIRHNY